MTAIFNNGGDDGGDMDMDSHILCLVRQNQDLNLDHLIQYQGYHTHLSK